LSSLSPWDKPTLVGSVVTLRPYAPRDVEGVWEMINDPEGNDLTGTTATFTRAQIEDWVATRPTAPERLDLVVVENATGEYAGEVVLNEFDAARRCANFRIALRGPGWYGRGLGGEATALVVRHAFEAIALESIVLDVRADNERAIRAYERAGFIETGRTDDERHTWVDMELARANWEATA